MGDITNFAVEVGIVDGMILDSGPSVEVFISDGYYTHVMKSVPTFIKNIFNIPKPVVYIAGNFF